MPNGDDCDVIHGDVLWFGADGTVKLAHQKCGTAVTVPPEVWVNAMLFLHPELAIGNYAD